MMPGKGTIQKNIIHVPCQGGMVEKVVHVHGWMTGQHGPVPWHMEVP
jgi:hypothetical protein